MRYTYCNDLKELDKLASDLEAFGEEAGVHPMMIHTFNLCLDEILTNIISYGFEDDNEHEIILEIEAVGDTVKAIISDDGKAFNPLAEVKDPDLDSPIEDREIGGLGVFFLKQMMDKLDYRREGGRNILTMEKTLPEEMKETE